MASEQFIFRVSAELAEAIEKKRAATGETKSQFAQRALAIAADVNPALAELAPGCVANLKQYREKPDGKSKSKKPNRKGGAVAKGKAAKHTGAVVVAGSEPSSPDPTTPGQERPVRNRDRSAVRRK